MNGLDGSDSGIVGMTTDIASPCNTSIASGIEGVFSLLGEEARETLLFHMSKRFGLSEEEFWTHPVTLGQALAWILGNGAHVIESKIAKALDQSNGDSKSKEFAQSMTWATNVELSNQRERFEHAGQN